MIAYLLFCWDRRPAAVYSVAQLDELNAAVQQLGGNLAAVVCVELRNFDVIATLVDLETLR